MRKILFIFIICPTLNLFQGAFAQWETWQPWVTDLGISPYAEISYRVAPPDSIGWYDIENGGMDLKLSMQVCLPPFYTQWGFSNIFNALLVTTPDTVVSPLYLNMRFGTQITYEEVATYDVSFSFIQTVGGDVGFTSLMIEGGYGRQFPLPLGEIQIMGILGGGWNREGGIDSLKKEVKKDKTLLSLSLGAFWRTPYATPYLSGGVSYPVSEEGFELGYFVAFGAQFVLPGSYARGVPDATYPKSGAFPKTEPEK